MRNTRHRSRDCSLCAIRASELWKTGKKTIYQERDLVTCYRLHMSVQRVRTHQFFLPANSAYGLWIIWYTHGSHGGTVCVCTCRVINGTHILNRWPSSKQERPVSLWYSRRKSQSCRSVVLDENCNIIRLILSWCFQFFCALGTDAHWCRRLLFTCSRTCDVYSHNSWYTAHIGVYSR